MQELKKCSRCSKLKPTSEFHKNKCCKDGLSASCKQCRAEYFKLIYIPKPKGVDKYEHMKRCRAFTPYTKEDLLSRPIEHTLELFTAKKLAQIWNISEQEAGEIKNDPWLVRLDYKHDAKCGEYKLTLELRAKLRKYIEETM